MSPFKCVGFSILTVACLFWHQFYFYGISMYTVIQTIPHSHSNRLYTRRKKQFSEKQTPSNGKQTHQNICICKNWICSRSLFILTDSILASQRLGIINLDILKKKKKKRRAFHGNLNNFRSKCAPLSKHMMSCQKKRKQKQRSVQTRIITIMLYILIQLYTVDIFLTDVIPKYIVPSLNNFQNS